MQGDQMNRVMTNQLDYDDDYRKVGHMMTVLAPLRSLWTGPGRWRLPAIAKDAGLAKQELACVLLS